MALDNFRTIELIWDKANKSIIKTIKTASSDTTGRYLSVKILDGGQEVALNSASLQLYWEHPNFNTSGTDIFEVVNNSGLFMLKFSQAMQSNVGTLDANLVLKLADGTITSDTFEIEVIKGSSSGVVIPSNGDSAAIKAVRDAIDKLNNFDGGPSIFMDTLSELQTTYPNGTSGVALVRETDPAKIYVWNGSSWEDFGNYQGIEIEDGTITLEKLSENLRADVLYKESFNETFANQDNFTVKQDLTNLSTGSNGLEVAVEDNVKWKEIVRYVGSVVGKELRFTISTTTIPKNILVGYSDTTTFNTSCNISAWLHATNGSTPYEMKLRQSNANFATLLSTSSNQYFNDNKLYFRLVVNETSATLELHSDNSYSDKLYGTTINNLSYISELKYLYIRALDGKVSGIKISRMEFSDTIKSSVKKLESEVSSIKKNNNVLDDVFFDKLQDKTIQTYFQLNNDGSLQATRSTTLLVSSDVLTGVVDFNDNIEYSYELNVDTTKNFGAMIGFNDVYANTASPNRLLIGYEPAFKAIAVYHNGSFTNLITDVTNGQYKFVVQWSKKTNKFVVYINGTKYVINDYVSVQNVTWASFRLQLKTTDLGLILKDLKLRYVDAEFEYGGITGDSSVKKYSNYGATAGRNHHIYKFGGKGNDWCYVFTPSNYDPQRTKPYPFVIQNHGNGSNFDGTPQNTIWTSINQYRPQEEYNVDPSRFLLSPSPELDYSSPTIEALLDAGYVVCGAMNHADGLYGNNNCRNAMADFYYHMIKNYNVEEKANIMGASNGFMTSLNGAYLLGGVARVKSIIGVYPLADLVEHYFNYPNHQTAIESAYGISTGLTPEQFKSATRTYNIETMQIPFPPIKMWYSLGDTVTIAEHNTLSLADKLESRYLIHEEVEATGNHGDKSHFDSSAFVAWFDKYL